MNEESGKMRALETKVSAGRNSRKWDRPSRWHFENEENRQVEIPGNGIGRQEETQKTGKERNRIYYNWAMASMGIYDSL